MSELIAPRQVNLKSFGLQMAGILAVIAIFLQWRDRDFFPYFYGTATLFAVLAILKADLLAGFQRFWSKFGELLGMIVGTLVLTVMFYGLMAPLGLLLRCLGYDLLDQKIDRSSKSYWKPVEKDGPSTRPWLPY